MRTRLLRHRTNRWGAGARLQTSVALPPVLMVMALVALAWGLLWISACDSGDSDGETTTTVTQEPTSGDIEGTVGSDVAVGEAVITVKVLQATFQPAMPTQRMVEETPPAPAAGESFYQAQVRVARSQGGSTIPLRVDPADFACMVGNSVVTVDPTRTGPKARSLLSGTSLDLLLTFKGPAGFQPRLVYSPPWHAGVVSIGLPDEGTATTE